MNTINLSLVHGSIHSSEQVNLKKNNYNFDFAEARVTICVKYRACVKHQTINIH